MKNLLSRKNFKIGFIIYVFTNTLALGYLGISINPLSYFILIWAIGIIIYDLYKRQIDFKNYQFLLLVSYGLILLLATIINDFSSQKSYLMALLQLVIFVLIYGNRKDFKLSNIKEELQVIIPLTNILVNLACSISIIMYLTKFSDRNNGWPIGMVEDRLFGVFFNCNPASFLAISVIILALIAIKNNTKHRKLYIYNIVVLTTYIILTKCRSALIILAIIIAALCYAYFIRSKNYSRLKRFLITSLICISIFLSSILVTNQLSKIFNGKAQTSRFQIEQVIEAMNLFFNGNIDPALQLIDRVSSGRIELLATSYHIWQTSPVIGVGADNFQTIGIHLNSGSVVQQIQVVHSHNLFIETVVTTGIIGAAIFILFLLSTIKTLLQLFNTNNFEHYLMIMLFTLIVVSEFIGSQFDYGVFYTYCLSATLAWLFLGYLQQIEKSVCIK